MHVALLIVCTAVLLGCRSAGGRDEPSLPEPVAVVCGQRIEWHDLPDEDDLQAAGRQVAARFEGTGLPSLLTVRCWELEDLVLDAAADALFAEEGISAAQLEDEAEQMRVALSLEPHEVTHRMTLGSVRRWLYHELVQSRFGGTVVLEGGNGQPGSGVAAPIEAIQRHLLALEDEGRLRFHDQELRRALLARLDVREPLAPAHERNFSVPWWRELEDDSRPVGCVAPPAAPRRTLPPAAVTHGWTGSARAATV